MGGVVMEREYRSANGVVEKTRFIVGSNTRRWKGKRTGTKSSLKKVTENDKAAVRRLARVLNCNFERKDLLLTFTVGEEWIGRQSGMNELRERLNHDVELWKRRVFRKSGRKPKYVIVVSDMDGDTGEVVRIHAHVVMQAGISWDLIQSEWKAGEVSIRELRDQDDYTPIATYLLRQVRRVPEQQKYRCSKNMVQPKITERIVAAGGTLRCPTTGKLLESNIDAESCSQYIRYKRKPAGKRAKQKKETEDAMQPFFEPGRSGI